MSGEVPVGPPVGMRTAPQQLSQGGDSFHFVLYFLELGRNEAGHFPVEADDFGQGFPGGRVARVKGLDAGQEFLTTCLQIPDGLQIAAAKRGSLFSCDFEKGGQPFRG